MRTGVPVEQKAAFSPPLQHQNRFGAAWGCDPGLLAYAVNTDGAATGHQPGQGFKEKLAISFLK